MDDHRRLAALAVFRELYDSRKSLYDILREFIIETIASQNIRSFSGALMATKIEENFGLRVPEAVVKSALNSLSKNSEWCGKQKGAYIVENMPEGITSGLEQKYTHRQSVNKDIFRRLVEYINSRREQPLNTHEEKAALDSFCSFLLNERNGEAYSDYISSFVLGNESDDQFLNDLNEIREGVILYSGITYNGKQTEVGSWKDELTLFLDQEILFHCYGLNGELFKSYFDEFNRFVIEINASAKKKLIRMFYFKETKDEVDSFFSYAEMVVRGELPVRPGNTAMQSIVNGYQSASDVKEKRTDFYRYLDTIGIRLDESFVFDESKFPHNILSASVYETIVRDVWQNGLLDERDGESRLKEKATRALNILNKIHCMRGSAQSDNFYAVKYHFLTGTAKTHEAALHPAIKGSEAIPLATSLDWMINKFWFKLNKGFKGEKFPASSQVLAKARVVLSTIVNRSVGKKFDELVVQHKKGELPKDLVQARIVDLMKQTVRPEEVDAQSVDQSLEIIQRDSLEHFKAEQEASKVRQRKQHEEIERLRQELAQKDREASDLKADHLRLESGRELERVTEEILKEKSVKETADKRCSLWCRTIYVTLALVVVTVVWGAVLYFTMQEWNSLEPKLAAIQIAWPLVFFLILVVWRRPLTPERVRVWLENSIQKRVYESCDVCEDRTRKLKEQANDLKINLQ